MRIATEKLGQTLTHQLVIVDDQNANDRGGHARLIGNERYDGRGIYEEASTRSQGRGGTTRGREKRGYLTIQANIPPKGNCELLIRPTTSDLRAERKDSSISPAARSS